MLMLNATDLEFNYSSYFFWFTFPLLTKIKLLVFSSNISFCQLLFLILRLNIKDIILSAFNFNPDTKYSMFSTFILIQRWLQKLTNCVKNWVAGKELAESVATNLKICLVSLFSYSSISILTKFVFTEPQVQLVSPQWDAYRKCSFWRPVDKIIYFIMTCPLKVKDWQGLQNI